MAVFSVAFEQAVAKESGATFINVSLSALNSKWVGDTEKYISSIFRCVV